MKYHIITLGCPKNAVDSEGMGGILSAQGHAVAESAEDADVVIVNTCSFIAAAREETLAVLRPVSYTHLDVYKRQAFTHLRTLIQFHELSACASITEHMHNRNTELALHQICLLYTSRCV